MQSYWTPLRLLSRVFFIPEQPRVPNDLQCMMCLSGKVEPSPQPITSWLASTERGSAAGSVRSRFTIAVLRCSIAANLERTAEDGKQRTGPNVSRKAAKSDSRTDLPIHTSDAPRSVPDCMQHTHSKQSIRTVDI